LCMNHVDFVLEHVVVKIQSFLAEVKLVNNKALKILVSKVLWAIWRHHFNLTWYLKRYM
jgi:hypothetical protein